MDKRWVPWIVVVVGLGALLVVWQRQSPPSDAAAVVAEAEQEDEVQLATPEGTETLRFQLREGNLANHFYRRGPVAAHLVARDGTEPRLIVAFPAGNSGTGLWFEPTEAQVRWKVVDEPEGVERDDGMRGIRAELEVTTPQLAVERPVLGSIRSLRNHMHGEKVDERLSPEARVEEAVTWSRAAIDEKTHYEVALEPLDGTRVDSDGDKTVFEADETIRLRLTALTDEPPLTPIPSDSLLTDDAIDDATARNVLAFLTYEEKLLAGSWRFLTYFGRDTLLSVRLLMPVLQPPVIEAGLGSVLERLRDDGAVPHEESIGEWPLLDEHGEQLRTDERRAPRYDYAMIDDDFMLGPVAASYLLETEQGRQRAAKFLGRETASGETYGQALVRNLRYVVEQTGGYAEQPGVETLLALQEGHHAGQWRDSDTGLAGGRLPYDVNAIFVPAALQSAAALAESEHLEAPPELAERARALHAAWAERAREHFEVVVPRARAAQQIREYAEQMKVPAEPALETLPARLSFPGVALGEGGEPLPVLHTDEGFELLFREPAPDRVDAMVTRMLRPFPAGLRTDVGIVVANPAFGNAEVREQLGREEYHGTVVWPWHHALLLSGIRRQLQRESLTEPVRERLTEAERAVWERMRAGEEIRTTELWSWDYDEDAGRYRIVPFGQDATHTTESNAAQLWSTVHLALQAP